MLYLNEEYPARLPATLMLPKIWTRRMVILLARTLQGRKASTR